MTRPLFQAPGSGPRHVVLSPNGRYGCVVNQLRATVTVFQYDAGKGSLKELQTLSALPKEFKGPFTAADYTRPSVGQIRLFFESRA
jgi:6-phosphogluconolactonase